jgi:hypothetical protein
MVNNSRNYKREYEIRKARYKRVHAEIESDKARVFIQLLQTRGITFVEWLNKKIDDDINSPN